MPPRFRRALHAATHPSCCAHAYTALAPGHVQARTATMRMTSWWSLRCGTSWWRACGRWAACSRQLRPPPASRCGLWVEASWALLGAGGRAGCRHGAAPPHASLSRPSALHVCMPSCLPSAPPCCSQAVNAYQRLAALLRGEYPPGLLPPAPQGYIVARIRELAGAQGVPSACWAAALRPKVRCMRVCACLLVFLQLPRCTLRCLHGMTPEPPPLLRLPTAEGSCMAAFEWNRGGEWGGKPWSAELPTDSALVFYLFASYLAAPQWLFPQVGWAAGRSVLMSGASRRMCPGMAQPQQLSCCDGAAAAAPVCAGRCHRDQRPQRHALPGQAAHQAGGWVRGSAARAPTSHPQGAPVCLAVAPGPARHPWCMLPAPNPGLA